MRRKPDFLILGVQKGGTSSLFDYLAQHPDIITPPEKELHFFDLEYEHGIRWYLRQFPKKKPFSKQLTGEGSPYYLFHPLVPERIHKHLPKIKFLVLLRNPSHRAFSHYQMQKRRKIERKGFLEAVEFEKANIAREEDRIRLDPGYYSELHQRFSYLSRGHYHEQITRWFSLFPKDNFHFIKSEDFFDNPKKELGTVYDFLGIHQTFPSDLEARFTGDYSPLEPEIATFLDYYYQEKNANLQKLIGDKFHW